MVKKFSYCDAPITAVISNTVAALILVVSTSVASTSYAASPMPPDPSLTGQPLKFTANLTPEEESHVVHSPATGFGEFTLDRETMTLSWRITYYKMTSTVTGAHAHGPQSPGGNAGVLFPLAQGVVSSPINGSFIISAGQLEYILTGRVYVNIHTEKYNDGELRAPIMRIRVDSPTQ